MRILNHLPRPTEGSPVAGSAAVDLAGRLLSDTGTRWAHSTSSPEGDRCSVDQRLAEILARYPPESVVRRSTAASVEALRPAVNLIVGLIGGR